MVVGLSSCHDHTVAMVVSIPEGTKREPARLQRTSLVSTSNLYISHHFPNCFPYGVKNLWLLNLKHEKRTQHLVS